jgi:hypothetical protein
MLAARVEQKMGLQEKVRAARGLTSLPRGDLAVRRLGLLV